MKPTEQKTSSANNEVSTEEAARKAVELAQQRLKDGGFTRITETPVYYSPTGAGDLVCAILDYTLAEQSEETESKPKNKDDKKPQNYYRALVLADFTNGTVTGRGPNGVKQAVKQPDLKPGDVIRLGEKHQLKMLTKYVGRKVAIQIYSTHKVVTRNNQEVWNIEIGVRKFNDSELALWERATMLPDELEE